MSAARGTCLRRSVATPSDTPTMASAAGISSRASRIDCRVLMPLTLRADENVMACRTTTLSRPPRTSLANRATKSVVSSVDNSATGRSRRTYFRNLGTAVSVLRESKSTTRTPSGTISRYSPSAFTSTRSTPTPRSANPEASVSITRSAPPPRMEAVNSATLPPRVSALATCERLHRLNVLRRRVLGQH